MNITKFFALFFLSLNLVTSCAEPKTNLKRKAESAKENPQKPKKPSLRLNAVVKRMLTADEPGIVAYLEKNHTRIDLDKQEQAAGETMLMAASFHKNVPVMQALIGLKANVNVVNFDGSNALHYQFGMIRDFEATLQATNLLLKAKANVNQQNKAGKTPLIRACLEGVSALINPLLQAGADTSIQIPAHIQTSKLKNGKECRSALDFANKFKEDSTDFYKVQAGDHMIKTLEEHQKTMDIVRPLIDEHNFPDPVAYIVGEYCGKEKPKEFNY